MRIYYDFHIHTALSPCGDDDMTPCNIVGMAGLKGLDAIAVTDHNSVGNARAVMAASRAMGGPLVIPGMELETAENVHLICLFAEIDAAEQFGRAVRAASPAILNKPEIFGAQLFLDENDRIIGTEERLLLSATRLTLAGAAALTHAHGGICYPAHIDRPSFGLLGVFGEIPDTPPFFAVEISPSADSIEDGQSKDLLSICSQCYNIMSGSDAHRLECIFEREHFLEVSDLSARSILAAVEAR